MWLYANDGVLQWRQYESYYLNQLTFMNALEHSPLYYIAQRHGLPQLRSQDCYSCAVKHFTSAKSNVRQVDEAETKKN